MSYVEPISNTTQYLTATVPRDEARHEDFKNTFRKVLIVSVVNDLNRRQENYFNYLITFKDIRGKQTKLILVIREELQKGFAALKNELSLEAAAVIIYEQIFPYLAMLQPKTDIYTRLLQYIENQTLEYSGKDLPKAENVYSVKS